MLLTAKPSIKQSASIIINAFIINRNKPKVNIVIGKVKIIKMGLTNKFKRAKTMATINAETIVLPPKVTPGRR